MTEATERARMFAAACSGMFCFGIVLALLGALFGLPAFRDRLHIDLAQQGSILSLLYVGVLIASPLAGPVIDRFGTKLVLLLCTLLVMASLLGFVGARSFWEAAASGIVLGIGGGGLNVATNSLVSDVFAEQRGSYLNYLGIFYGFGALLIPFLAATISARFTPGEIILCAVVLAGACALAYAVLRFPPPREAHTFSAREVARVATYPGVLLFAFLLFFQSGDEAVIGGWTTRYAGAMGATARQSEWMLFAVLAAVMLGRMVAGRVVRRLGAATMVLTCLCASLLSYIFFWWARTLLLQFVGAALVGFFFAAIYPTTLAIVGNRYPRFSASVFSLIFTIALIGGITFPWIVGQVASAYGLRAGMVLPIAGCSAAVLLMLVIRAGKPPRSPAAE